MSHNCFFSQCYNITIWPQCLPDSTGHKLLAPSQFPAEAAEAEAVGTAAEAVKRCKLVEEVSACQGKHGKGI